LTGLFVLASTQAEAQNVASPTAAGRDPASVEPNTVLTGRWEFTIDGRIFAPTGRLQVGEFPTGSSKAGGAPGTQLRLSDLGIDVAGALQGSAAFHFTANDAVRISYEYTWLRGSSTISQSIVFNGQEFTAGSLTTNADYWQISAAYERALISRPTGERLVGTVGLTYVYFNPTLTGTSPPGTGVETHGRSNSEDFYRQELPVPKKNLCNRINLLSLRKFLVLPCNASLIAVPICSTRSDQGSIVVGFGLVGVGGSGFAILYTSFIYILRDR